jgi:DNA repair protein RecN (Recombination protein N)
LIKKLKKKYGTTIEEILQYASDAKSQLSGMENWDSDKETLKSQIAAEEAAIVKTASVLSEKRKKTATALSAQITAVLQSLGMKKAVFQVQIRPRVNESGKMACGPYGYDQIEFIIAPNPGEPFKPLRSSASGGEISRVMLAIKSVAADKDRIGTIVFDEIDAGIGGEVALSVGEHLQKLASSKQILCITHLASIAVRADNHLKVFKESKEDRTISRVGMVESGEEKVGEIARMLAGDKETDASLNHARELLSRYSAASGRRG